MAIRKSWILAGLALALLFVACGWSSNQTSRSVTPADPGATTSAVITFFEERVRRDTQDFVSYNKLAGAYIQRARELGDVTDYNRAEAALKASLQSLPNDNYDALAQLALVYVSKHQFAEALSLAQQAIALDPADPFGYAVLGDAHLALGRYPEAQEAYERIVAIAPGLSSFSRLAYLLELKGDLGGAELMWRNALASDSGLRAESTAWARVQLGHFLFNSGNPRGAEKEYKRALAAFPGYVHALAGVARVQAAHGNYDEAIDFYRQVVARYPIPEYVIVLGDVYRAAGRERDAARQYDLVATIDRLYKANGVNTNLEMALFLADHDLDLNEALRQARAAYHERPSIQAADALAWALYKLGRYKEALAYSDKALRLGTQDALMRFHAGMAHYRLGDYEQARDYLEGSLALNPRFSVLYAETAVETLKELESLVQR